MHLKNALAGVANTSESASPSRIARSSRQLAERLAAGGGYEETLNVAKKIRSLVRDAEVQGAKIMTTVWMEKELRPVESLLARLGRYYFD